MKDVAKTSSPALPESDTDVIRPGITVTEPKQSGDKPSGVQVRIVSNGGNVNIRRGNGLEYSLITSVAPDTVLPWIASATNGWHAVKIGKQVGWIIPEFSELV